VASCRAARSGAAGLARSWLRPGVWRICALAAAIVIGGSSDALACPMCFGAEESSLVDGARLGILVMLGITFAVQGGFLGFFLYLRRRAKRNADEELDDEWAELQKASGPRRG
jgi:hypothetical protein